MSDRNTPLDASTAGAHHPLDHALDALDAAQADAHTHERAVPHASPTFLKDDRRSSTRLTEREASERWPLG